MLIIINHEVTKVSIFIWHSPPSPGGFHTSNLLLFVALTPFLFERTPTYTSSSGKSGKWENASTNRLTTSWGKIYPKPEQKSKYRLVILLVSYPPFSSLKRNIICVMIASVKLFLRRVGSTLKGKNSWNVHKRVVVQLQKKWEITIRYCPFEEHKMKMFTLSMFAK